MNFVLKLIIFKLITKNIKIGHLQFLYKIMIRKNLWYWLIRCQSFISINLHNIKRKKLNEIIIEQQI